MVVLDRGPLDRAVRQAFYLINNALRSHKKLRAWIFEVLLSQIRKQNVD